MLSKKRVNLTKFLVMKLINSPNVVGKTEIINDSTIMVFLL